MSEPIHYPGVTSCGCPYIMQPDPKKHWKECHYRLNCERDDRQAEAFEAHLVANHCYQPYTLRSLRRGDSYEGIALWLAWSAWQARPAQTALHGTTGDKYRAELYDEVWEKARSMGYGNVTNALIELESMKTASQPEQSALVDVAKDVISNLGEWCCGLQSQEQGDYVTSQLDLLHAALSAQGGE